MDGIKVKNNFFSCRHAQNVLSPTLRKSTLKDENAADTSAYLIPGLWGDFYFKPNIYKY